MSRSFFNRSTMPLAAEEEQTEVAMSSQDVVFGTLGVSDPEDNSIHRERSIIKKRKSDEVDSAHNDGERKRRAPLVENSPSLITSATPSAVQEFTMAGALQPEIHNTDEGSRIGQYVQPSGDVLGHAGGDSRIGHPAIMWPAADEPDSAREVELSWDNLSTEPVNKKWLFALLSTCGPVPANKQAALSHQINLFQHLQTAQPDLSMTNNHAEQKHLMQNYFQGHPDDCSIVLAGIQTQREGWCDLATLNGNKPGGAGYVQISWNGVNKCALLHHLVLWSHGGSLSDGEQCSHLCDHPKCRIINVLPSDRKIPHVVSESMRANQRRKNCQAQVPCSIHPGKYRNICTHYHEGLLHSTRCIRVADGFASYEEFIAGGLCDC